MKKQRERLKDREGVNKEFQHVHVYLALGWVGFCSGHSFVVQCSIVFNKHIARSC